jgi:hypothetical protein
MGRFVLQFSGGAPFSRNARFSFAIVKVTRPSTQRTWTNYSTRKQGLLAIVEKQQIMSDLLCEFPQFQNRWREHSRQWGEDAGPSLGMVIFAHFVIDGLYERENYEGVQAVFDRMEAFLRGGTQEVRDLIGLGFIQTMQNIALLKPYGSDAFVRFLGVETRSVWAQLEAIWRASIGLDSSDRTTLEAEVLIWRMLRAALNSERSVTFASSS